MFIIPFLWDTSSDLQGISKSILMVSSHNYRTLKLTSTKLYVEGPS